MHVKAWMGILIALMEVASVTAAESVALPEGALAYRAIMRLWGLPPSDVATLPALAPGWHGPPALLWLDRNQISIPVPLPAAGKYEIQIAHLAGGSFAPLQITYPGGPTATTPNVTGDPRVDITKILTPLLPGSDLSLTLSTQAKVSGIGLVYVAFRIVEYEAVPATLWSVGARHESPDDSVAALGLDQPGSLDIPAEFAKAELEREHPGHVMMPLGKTGCAMTYLYHDLAFSGHGLSVSSGAGLRMYVNGQRVVSSNDALKEAPLTLVGHKLNRGVNRIVVVMPATADKSHAWFELRSSNIQHTRLCREIPDIVDPRRVNTDWPRIVLSKGDTRAEVPVPDSRNGFYRSVRFEAGGQITSLRIGDQDIYTTLHADHQPTGIDHVAGPAEEFFEALGFEETAFGEPFMKLGVGLLRKPVEDRYFFGATYFPERFFDWQVDPGPDAVTFTQTGQSPAGDAYHYVKRLRLTEAPKGLVIEHILTNTGSRTIVTNQYSHEFIRLRDSSFDDRYRIEFPFNPFPKNDVSAHLRIQDRVATPLGKVPFFTPLFGYEDASHNWIVIHHLPSQTKLRVRQDQPLSRLWLMATDRVVCPEMFTRIDLAPGQTRKWTRHLEVE